MTGAAVSNQTRTNGSPERYESVFLFKNHLLCKEHSLGKPRLTAMATFVQISAKLRRVDLVVPINARRTHNKFNEFPIVK
jgi:hypothetical protein